MLLAGRDEVVPERSGGVEAAVTKAFKLLDTALDLLPWAW